VEYAEQLGLVLMVAVATPVARGDQGRACAILAFDAGVGLSATLSSVFFEKK